MLASGNIFANSVSCTDNPDNLIGVISYDLTANNSYCELCGIGRVRLVITNPTHVDMSDFTITHDFLASGLEYVPGSSTGGNNPVISGTQLQWTAAQIPGLAAIDGSNPNNHNFNTVEITFNVRSIAGTEEALVTANRNVSAEASYNFCPATTNTPATATDSVELPILEPVPSVIKLGRNVDSAQGSGSYSSIVYGNVNDDVIWRIQISNSGSAALQDLKFNDLMQDGNFDIRYACPTEAAASAQAASTGPNPVGACTDTSISNSITDFIVDAPFGAQGTAPDGNELDVLANNSTFIYLVGKLNSSCNTNKTNTVSNIEWGCESVGSDGGIAQTSASNGSISAGLSTATISSLAVTGGLQIQRQLTGLNTNQPVGSRGLMTITINNQTGGSVKNIKLRDVLPAQYVVDSTFTPSIAVTPLYGAYAGMIDTIDWINPQANTLPLINPPAGSPADPLLNIAPEFDLLSSTVNPDHADQVNMLRHGDVAIVRFRVVMIEPAYFDNNANIDVRVENTGDTTDPANSVSLTNQLYVSFENFCAPGVTQQPASYPFNDNFNSSPEDIDIDITGTELIFILTNDPTQPLPLQISLTNNGGHYADDYYAYVTFGTTMEVITAPAGCSVTTNPPALEVWDQPTDLPASATVYECNSSGIGTLAPGQTRNLNFEVIKTSDLARQAEDDLSLRADVIGEVTLSDGTPLWFPAPNKTLINNRANNYSLDAVRARVIGFNLTKNQVGNCSENNPPTTSPDTRVQIGEECTMRIDTGGWFGFQTPGFTYIAVQRVQVVDELPNGQAYISSTDPALTSSASITGISLNLPSAIVPVEGAFNWTFNQDVPAERITVRDQWFQANTTTRILNKPIDIRATPNVHAAVSRNVLNSTFEAVFNNALTGLEEVFSLGSNTIGYPSEPLRRVDLTVTEPNIQVTKRVCNETLYGSGPTCSNFVSTASDGDTQDLYIYRITITNQASSGGVARAPAYNITLTDVLDPSDLMLVVPFNADGIDNDSDGLFDLADTDGEGNISDNTISNAIPATITFAHTNSTALLKLNPGSANSVSFYYRVNPDDAISPLQQLNNTVAVNYDSMEGDSGNQTVVLGANSELGGARVYNSTPASARVQILPLQSQPKEITRLSNTSISGLQPQPVSVGEEIEYQLRTLIPVANLRAFTIRDELPAGIDCIEAPQVNLNAAPYSAAGFSPGGVITPTCTDSYVEWDFGDQELTAASSNNLFDFAVKFIARVNNSASVNEANQISNGTPNTNAYVSYINEASVQVVNNFNNFDLIIREPVIALSKTFESVSNDSGDVITVTVSATNTGTANAYNLRVLDDLAAVANLTFLNNVGGTDPPDLVDVASLGANRPIFSWNPVNPDFAIAPGETKTFSFDILVDIGAQPDELLDNTIQASWTSLPSQTTALNTSALIGANGSPDGMRNGALPNSSDAVNDYETSATTFTTVPALTISKNDLSAGLNPEIGAHKNFELVINLPEGTTNNLVVSDELDHSGLSYVLSNNLNFDISYSFNNIISINGTAPAEAVMNAFPADATSGAAVWNIGTVVTAEEDDTSGAPAINPSIVINYYARINNDTNTDSGSQLQNTVTTTYTHGESAGTVNLTAATAIVTATEPLLSAVKTVSPVSAAPITGGDILAYSITITNNGNAKAYDVNIVDSLPAVVVFDNSFTPTALIDSVSVAGFNPTPLNSPAGPLIWGRANADQSLDIDAGSTLVLTYHVQIQADAEANMTLNNSVMIDWTSLDGVSSYERTGANCPTITTPNDYCAGPYTATSIIDDSSSLTKSVVSDTFAPANDAVLRVGDIVTYQLSLNLQEGTTRSVSVLDVLPSGMEFVDIVSINGDNTADYTAPAVGAGSNFSYTAVSVAALPAAGQTGNLNFAIGDIINDPFADNTTDTLAIIYRARVVENVVPHQSATNLSNTATLHYIDAASISILNPARLQNTATISVRQPIMTVPTKTDRSGRTTNTNVQIATDVMNFRLSSCNTSGLAPAYSVQITDLLATQLNETTIAGPLNGAGQPDVYINGVLATAGVDYNYSAPLNRGGNLIFELLAGVDPAQCVTIDYDIGFYTDFGLNQNWNNTVIVDEYWSLPLKSGQLYAALGPTIFTMMNNDPYVPPLKVLTVPVSGEATIGEEVVYQITLPVSNAARFDVVVTDTLDASLEYVSATEISGNGFVLTDNSTLPGNVSLSTPFIPAGQEMIVELRARVANNAAANAGYSFNNTTTYRHANSAGGATILAGSATTTTPLRIIEPSLAIAKAVANLTNPGNLPVAGDLLRYTVTLAAAGTGAGDNYSNVFDVSLLDQQGLGLRFQPGSSQVTGPGNSISDPAVTGDGINTAQTLSWNLADATANIDLAEGATITVSYEVLVLDTTEVNQPLNNSIIAQWTSLQGISTSERNGTETPSVNDYVTAPALTTINIADYNTINKTRINDTFNSIDSNVRVGDVVHFRLSVYLQEGQTNNVIVTDTLPQGLVFENVTLVGGDLFPPYSAAAPFSYNDITVVSSGDPLSGSSTVSFNFGDVTNAADNNNNNDTISIIYTARVLNDVHPQQDTLSLTNTAELSYDSASGPLSKTSSISITLLQPQLVLTKTAVAAGGDTILVANELVTYTLDITNTGLAPAYDVVIEDIIPQGMRNGTATITQISTTLVNATTSLPNITPVYDVNSGVAVWNFDTGSVNTHTIPAGETLRLVYQVQTDANLGAGINLINQATARLYYSFDNNAVPSLEYVTGVREIYGPSNTATVTLTTTAAGALLKENPAVLTAAIGETFSYQITIPATPIATALHDVRILDNLAASLADLTFVSVSKVSGTLDWTPVNTGTATNVIIEDITTGIDIPPNEQVVISLTVQVADTTNNVSGLLFNNTADYTYNFIPGDPATQLTGGGFTTPDMTIVGPDSVTLQKTGPASMRLGMPETFTLNVQNTGTGTAWDLTITDQLPDFAPLPGGMCDSAPANISAQIFLADGITAVSTPLIENTDFRVNFAAAPACIFTVTMLSENAALATTNRLIVTYEAALDLDTPTTSTLINVAGVTQWFSADTDGSASTPAHSYNRVLTDGTPSDPVPDHEDNHTVTIDTPEILLQKRVFNVSTGQDPGTNAEPGDVLRYSIFIQNLSALPVDDFNFVDDLDALNSTAMFVAGSLNIISVPLGSNTSNTNVNGGSKGTGRVDIRQLALGIAGSANDTVNIEFEVTLVPVITNGTVVLNQGFIQNIEINLATDDPNVNGIDDTTIKGDENATETLISSAAAFDVYKTSTDLTDDPAVLVSGDTLRYTITVKNIGSENAINAVLRDQLPANTTYLAGTTTLNGNLISDAAGDVLPLQTGVAINSANTNVPGLLQADPSINPANIATITFDVLINPDLINGTIISNQAFLTAEGAGSPALPDKASDDPATLTVDDPTRDVIGNQPLLDALKLVEIEVDNSTPGILDPGDILRYTIIVNNIGATAATEVSLTDLVPVNTIYIANSVTMNGLPVGQPDAGVSPLATGIAISSSDLVSSTLVPAQPLPTAGNGTISAGESAVITFNVQVVPTAVTGDIISNQGTVESYELPPELTDADGIDANGDQPTLIAVGNAQLLRISKDVAVVGGGAALAGSELEYRIRVTNIGQVPAMTVLISDDLDLPIAAQMTYVPGSGLLNGLTTGVSYSAPVLTADYGTNYGSLEPGQMAELRFTVQLNNTLPLGTTVTNIAEVYWNAGTQNDSASVSIDIGGIPGVGNINGSLWHDANFNNSLDSGEQILSNWHIDLLRDGQLLGTQQSDENGLYQFSGLSPNDVGAERYEVHFRAPGATNTTALLGLADSPVAYGFSNGQQVISNIVLSSGSNAQGLNLPIDPNGVVYDSIVRTPIAGATISMLNAATGLEISAGCFDNQAQQNQVTLSSGYYKFDLNFTQSDCNPGDQYLIRITPPSVDYVNQPSLVITPQTDATTAALDVPSCPASANDAIIATADTCEAQVSEFAPAVGVAAGSADTNYYLHLTLTNTQIPGDSQLFNNHLPIDPVLTSAVSISKVSALVNVSRSQLVPYTITVTNTLPVALNNSQIIDNFPAGFKYVENSARLNGVALEPVRTGLQLAWNNIDLPVNVTQTIKLLLIVGAGVNDGEYVNRAHVFDTQTNGNASGEASATVRVIPDPAFDCSDVIGKVFDDKNLNAYQDDGEDGLAGIRVVTARGLAATSDQHGRFHITCAVSPDEQRGSNFILKLDERTLPTGYRMTSENPRVQRATRGKMMKFNFAATIHRVVSMDLGDGVFIKGSDEIHDLWKPRIDLLMLHLQQMPSVLHLSYLADTETESLVNDRLEKLKTEIANRWDNQNQNRLVIETEIFWRRGGPADRGDIE